MQAYSDPKRENDPHALPDVEVWRDKAYRVECSCGEYDIPEPAMMEDLRCPSCGQFATACGGISMADGTPKKAWFWWFCYLGCMPDSEPFGPYDTQEAALAAAQENAS